MREMQFCNLHPATPCQGLETVHGLTRFVACIVGVGDPVATAVGCVDLQQCIKFSSGQIIQPNRQPAMIQQDIRSVRMGFTGECLSVEWVDLQRWRNRGA